MILATFFFVMLSIIILLVVWLFINFYKSMSIFTNAAIVFLLLFQVLLLVISGLVVFELFRSLILGYVPFVRSAKKIWKKLQNEISESPGKVFYDLGCGDASLLFLVEKHKKMKVKGLELGPLPYLISKLKAFFYKSKADIKRKDFFKNDYSDANFVYMYLLHEVVDKVEAEIVPKLKPGTIVICNTFNMQNHAPYKTVDVYPEKRLNQRLYFYKV